MTNENIAFVSCNYSNRESIVLTDRNGDVLPDANPDEYMVIGLYHSDGPNACEDWIHCNRELVAELQANVFHTGDMAVGPAESDVGETCSLCTGECTESCSVTEGEIETAGSEQVAEEENEDLLDDPETDDLEDDMDGFSDEAAELDDVTLSDEEE